MADALSAAVAGLRVLADGTVRLTIDVEPKDRVAAMQLFGAPGQPVGLAALQVGHAAASDKPATSTYRDLGPICREAIDLCRNERFQAFATTNRGKRLDVIGDVESFCKDFITNTCMVESRQELDTADGARELFIAHVRKPFHAWLERQR